jgi:hypothetical protein
MANPVGSARPDAVGTDLNADEALQIAQELERTGRLAPSDRGLPARIVKAMASVP